MAENLNLMPENSEQKPEGKRRFFDDLELEYGIRESVEKSECARKTPGDIMPPRRPFPSELENWAQKIQEPPCFMVITLAEMGYLDFITSQMVENVLKTVQAILWAKQCVAVFVNMPGVLQNRFKQGQDWFFTEDEWLCSDEIVKMIEQKRSGEKASKTNSQNA